MNWKLIAEIQKQRYSKLFNVIIMDPPWRVALKLKYPTLSDSEIFSIPLEALMTDGYLFIWIIYMKVERIKKLLAARGFKYKAMIVWEKLTRNGKPVNGSGVTVRHSTEACFIFKRGNTSSFSKLHRATDLIRA